jgi:hypothetical protein
MHATKPEEVSPSRLPRARSDEFEVAMVLHRLPNLPKLNAASKYHGVGTPQMFIMLKRETLSSIGQKNPATFAFCGPSLDMARRVSR